MSEAKTYTLKHPIEVRAKDSGEVIERISALTFSRPTLRSMRAMDKAEGEIGKTIVLIAALTNQPPSVIDEMDAEDLLALAEVVQGFFGGFPPIGKASSAP